MKNQYVLVVLFTLVVNILYSQIEDDFEDYTVGEPVNADWWLDNCGSTGLGCELVSSDFFAYSGNKSGHVPNDGTTDAIVDFDQRIFGVWLYYCRLYIPSGKEAALKVLDQVPIDPVNGITWDIIFNPNNETPGEGYVSNFPGGAVPFTFQHDTWIDFKLKVDITIGISLATCCLIINNNQVLPDGTPFVDENEQSPLSFGGMELYSRSNVSEVYIDDVYLSEYMVSCHLGIEDQNPIALKIFPNPSKDILFLAKDFQVDEIQLLDYTGRIIDVYGDTEEIDVSNLPSGIYLLCFKNGRNIGFQKFIKE